MQESDPHLVNDAKRCSPYGIAQQVICHFRLDFSFPKIKWLKSMFEYQIWLKSMFEYQIWNYDCCVIVPFFLRPLDVMRRSSAEAWKQRAGRGQSGFGWVVERSSFRFTEYTPLICLINYPDYNLTMTSYQRAYKIYLSKFENSSIELK
jgi:hypothetical protein